MRIVRRVPQLDELLDDVRLRGRKAGTGGDDMSECRHDQRATVDMTKHNVTLNCTLKCACARPADGCLRVHAPGLRQLALARSTRSEEKAGDSRVCLCELQEDHALDMLHLCALESHWVLQVRSGDHRPMLDFDGRWHADSARGDADQQRSRWPPTSNSSCVAAACVETAMAPRLSTLATHYNDSSHSQIDGRTLVTPDSERLLTMIA